ncbi:TM2 domain-containing protein [Dethiosulfatarculus sandiegensis]|uniref:TM2 domain-containing protein n=1 Tax=Dethiosulfatarculus sandiegensis TaxID=1429043 RepID=UPI0005C814DF|nr:TM2 domain-containing protein [Dethiosulfatarculus sandiegensis]
MSLEINPSIAEKLPVIVKSSLAKMSTEEQSQFVEEYERKKKSLGLLMALAILFPIQLFLLGKTGLGVAFLLTAGGLWVWYFVEIFLTPKRVREYNADIATSILRDMKILQS